MSADEPSAVYDVWSESYEREMERRRRRGRRVALPIVIAGLLFLFAAVAFVALDGHKSLASFFLRALLGDLGDN